VIQACLIAPDAGIDFIGTVRRRLFHKVRIRQQEAGHGNHVGIAPGQHFFSYFGRIDAIAGYQRRGNPSFQSGGNPGKSSNPSGASSSPVCMEPIRILFFNRVNPRSRGANKCGYFEGFMENFSDKMHCYNATGRLLFFSLLLFA